MGKTSIIEKTIIKDCQRRNLTAFVITPLKSLALSDSKTLSNEHDMARVYNYLDEGTDALQIMVALEKPIVFLCYQGLFRLLDLDQKLLERHTVICDEATMMLEDQELSEEGYTLNSKAFRKICDYAKRMVFMDADFNERYYLHMISLLRKQSPGKRIIYERVDSFNAGKHYTFVDNFYDNLADIIDDINGGLRVWINVDISNQTDGRTHNKLNALLWTLQYFCPDKNGVGYDTHELPWDLRTDFANTQIEMCNQGLDFCIYSPAVGRGVSHLPDNQGLDFDVETTLQQSGHSNALTMFQGSTRPRRTQDHRMTFAPHRLPGERKFNEKLIHQECGFSFVDLDDEALYSMLVKDNKELLQANPQNHMKYLLDNKNCIRSHISVEDDIFEKRRDEIKEVYLKHRKHGKQSGELAEVNDYKKRYDILQRFVAYRYETKSFDLQLDPLHYPLGDKRLIAFAKRIRLIVDKSVISIIDCMLMSEQERKEWEQQHMFFDQWRRIYGQLIDATLRLITPCIEDQSTLLHHVISNSRKSIFIDASTENTHEIRSIINEHWKKYIRLPYPPSKLARENGAYAIKWLCKFIDYQVKLKADTKNAIELRDKLYQRLIKLHPGRFSEYDLLSVKTRKTVDYLLNKRKTDDLDDDETNYLQSKTGEIVIKKKDHVLIDLQFNPLIKLWCEKHQ